MNRILASFLTMLLVSTVRADDWPQWRGPTRDCQIAPRAWPNSLDSDHLKQSWRIPLGPSYSGPIVFGDRVFVTETQNKSDEVVRALDPGTGEELWKAQWRGAMSLPFFARENGSWIRSTPACDGKHLFVSGVRDVLVCLEAETGKEVWRVDFVKKLRTSQQAYMSSPAFIGDNIFQHMRNQRFTCVNQKTGGTNWATKPLGKYWSMIVNGNRILSLDQTGDLRLIEADSKEYKETSSRKVSSNSWAHLAVSGEQLFVRELDAISGWNWAQPKN